MAKLKQPDTLQNLAMNAVIVWLCKTGQNLMTKIAWVARTDAQKSSEYLKESVNMIHKLFLYNIPCYLFDNLSKVVFKKLPILIDNIKRKLKMHASMSEFLIHVNVAVSLGQIIISPHLHFLNFEEMPKMMRHLFYMRLKDLPGLVYLNLSTLSGGWKTEDMEPIVLNGIVDMKNLHTLILTYDCTDNILKILETSCPRIQVLDISSSKMIGNNSIKYLLELHHLKKVQLYRTSITIEGYIRLLTKMPQLENIGRYDAIGTCLEYIDMTYENLDEKPIIKLKVFESHYVVSKHIKLLAKWCPDIELVCLFHNPLLNDLMGLIAINKLSDLRLLSCNFFQDHVRDVLEVKGCNLTYLHLEHVEEIDINALMCISQYCPDLNTLIIYNCELIDGPLKYFRKQVPPFMNLKNLTIAASCTLQHLEFLLMNCFKIKFIHIGTMVPTNDEIFDKILANNPMEYLEELHIIYSTGLTVSTAYKLLETCENLKVLNEMESWTRVQEQELENFRIFLKIRNYNIDTRPSTWKPQIREENI
ncbi:F-box/LRR-repeat protein 2-like [Condylostylus longicornis]|uniref:F-box/LRR-repeat protein 2-like n=1 Tax=Condylostylus longicornis TaxID=2530218 RepID=UPI00244DEB86|nr:F-box/LRR-repeat protein 2-like [Condylostylus longicornis]XP_055383046.1 F-box/LRR-repeat protein 2-like [Condylostylus longicornis]XP_055383047.1 F-box/LRR-repeat protein 2-like [Condylostylus longicornis]XP_055383048.1 F-box/LRR-repeat protein 2-like [Condylostylus longicornis]